MNPTTPPTPEQQPTVPMAEIPAAPEVAAPSAVPAPAAAAPVASANVAQPASPAAAAAAPTAPATSGPAVAEDVDVIEKEWVDKASEVIAKTAGDPHAEEEAIEDLQIDYMKKRYGKDIARSED